MLLLALPSGSVRYGGPKARASSPVPGRSILITSAPKSPSIWADKGPASTRVRSRILMPESGRADMSNSSGNWILARRRHRGTRSLRIHHFGALSTALGTYGHPPARPAQARAVISAARIFSGHGRCSDLRPPAAEQDQDQHRGAGADEGETERAA